MGFRVGVRVGMRALARDLVRVRARVRARVRVRLRLSVSTWCTCDLEPSRSWARKRKPLAVTPLKPDLFSEDGTSVRPSASAAARTWLGSGSG